MGYSSIVQKKCRCGCGKWPTLGFKGFNSACQPEMKAEKLKQQKERNKKRNAIALDQRKLRKEDNKLLDGKAAKRFELQQQWFRKVIKTETERGGGVLKCWETGDYIPDKFAFAAVAHILPKKDGIGGFPSVSQHPLNYLILSAANGSHDKTHRWDKFQEMKVWGMAVSRFKNIYPYIAQSERKYLPDCLLQELTEAESMVTKNLSIH